VILYWDWLVPAPHDGVAYGPVIVIKKAHKKDHGLHAHEETHVKQFWRHWMLGYLWRYHRSWQWRFEYEAEAYRQQLLYSPDKRLLFASFLVSRYDLPINMAAAEVALQDKRP